jgi:hypothetical protein
VYLTHFTMLAVTNNCSQYWEQLRRDLADLPRERSITNRTHHNIATRAMAMPQTLVISLMTITSLSMEIILHRVSHMVAMIKVLELVSYLDCMRLFAHQN